MKLNNHGWGLRQMIVLSACLLIALLIATYFIWFFYHAAGIAMK